MNLGGKKKKKRGLNSAHPPPTIIIIFVGAMGFRKMKQKEQLVILGL